MANTTEKEAKICVKVFIDKVKKRVLYAEADHTFVDILFSFMTLPLGTIVRLLGKLDDKSFEALGSLNNLYQSLEHFPDHYFAIKEHKRMLLNPTSVAYDYCRNLKLKIDDTVSIEHYVCDYSKCSHVGKLLSCNIPFGKASISRYCGVCGQQMGMKYDCVGAGVFVSDTATFIITDDLRVEPYTSASCIRLLAYLGITDTNHVEERNIEMSSDQILHFFKMALVIDCPFTYLVFSNKKLSSPEFVCLQDNISVQHDWLNKEVSATSHMVLEVFYQKSTRKLLFAEGKEDFVEFLFSFLSIPLGTLIGTLMNGASSVKCMDNILESISTMSVGRYLKSKNIKDMLLKPHIGHYYLSKNHVFSVIVSDNKQKDQRTYEGLLIKQSSGVFLVTDGLKIIPSSSLSMIDILNKLKVSPEDIQGSEVNIGLKEGLSMLKTSLISYQTLTKSL
ncbi:hypothetical protein R6Q59_016329 [Mikania micrantha]